MPRSSIKYVANTILVAPVEGQKKTENSCSEISLRSLSLWVHKLQNKTKSLPSRISPLRFPRVQGGQIRARILVVTLLETISTLIVTSNSPLPDLFASSKVEPGSWA